MKKPAKKAPVKKVALSGKSKTLAAIAAREIARGKTMAIAAPTKAKATQFLAAVKDANKALAKERAAKAAIAMDEETVKQFAQWKDGEALQPMASARGMTYEQLRNRFIKLAGGKQEFFALRDAGAGSRATRQIGAKPTAGLAADDRGVPILDTTKGWKEKRYTRGRTVPVTGVGNIETYEVLARVFVRPEDGVEFIYAEGNERADLLVMSSLFSGSFTRLKLFSDTTRGKKILKEYADRVRRRAEEVA